MMECFQRKGPEDAGIMNNPAYGDCFIYTACGNFIATSKLSLAKRSSYFHQIFSQEHNKGKVSICMFEFSREIVKLALDVTFGSEVNVTVKQSGRLKFLLNRLKIKFEAKTTTAAVQQNETPASILGNQEEERAELQEEERTKHEEERAKVEEEKRTKNEQEQQEEQESECARNREELAKNEHYQPADVEQEKQPQSNSSLFNWTETTSDIDLENIFHIRITGQKGEKYLCIKCKATSNYYRLAEKHWNCEHKDFAKFRTLLIDSEFERKILESRCEEIHKKIVLKKLTDDGNLSMELRRMHEKVYEIMEKFDQVKRDDLKGAPTLIRKKHSMLKMLDDIGGKIDSAIDMLERP